MNTESPGETELPGNLFWAFSLEAYGRPGVAEACLALQDRHGLDVNLLLYCCWAGACGRVLSDAEVERLVAAVKPWRSAAVEPLRSLRRWLKDAEGARPDLAASFRERVKALELEAERIEQQTLGDTVPVEAGTAFPDPKAGAANLSAYRRVHGLRPGEQDNGALGVILAGCYEGLASAEALRLLG